MGNVKTNKIGIIRKIVKLLGYLCVGLATIMLATNAAYTFGSTAALVHVGMGGELSEGVTNFLQKVFEVLEKFCNPDLGLLINGVFLITLLVAGLILLVWGSAKTLVGKIIYSVLVGAGFGILCYTVWNVENISELVVSELLMIILQRAVEHFIAFCIIVAGFIVVLVLTSIAIKKARPTIAPLFIRVFGFIFIGIFAVILLVEVALQYLVEAAAQGTELPESIVNIIQNYYAYIIVYGYWVLFGSVAVGGAFVTLGSALGSLFFWVG